MIGQMRRVVVTGIGMVTPAGAGARNAWQSVLSGKSTARQIDSFAVDDLACRIACLIPRSGDGPGVYDPDSALPPKEQRKVDEFITFAVAASDEALQDSGWQPDGDESRDRAGVLIGSGIGGLAGIEAASATLRTQGPRRISPFFIPGRLINLASGYVSIKHGLRGPNHSVVTACSTGSHAIGDAGRLVAIGAADMMVAGGAESPICRISLAGFAACKALSTHFNDEPGRASRPYDAERDGFVMGEGAGVVVLESLEGAKARGAKIYGELVGYGMSGDAYHITAPAEDGSGAQRCMSAALADAGMEMADIDYVNAHGTSTPLGDAVELGAVERLAGEAAKRLTMSSTKSCIGHLLGAAGAVEAIFSLLAMQDNIAPPTINLDNPSVETAIDLVPNTKKEMQIDAVLSNSFGFGGSNASLIFKSCNG